MYTDVLYEYYMNPVYICCLSQGEFQAPRANPRNGGVNEDIADWVTGDVPRAKEERWDLRPRIQGLIEVELIAIGIRKSETPRSVILIWINLMVTDFGKHTYSILQVSSLLWCPQMLEEAAMQNDQPASRGSAGQLLGVWQRKESQGLETCLLPLPSTKAKHAHDIPKHAKSLAWTRAAIPLSTQPILEGLTTVQSTQHRVCLCTWNDWDCRVKDCGAPWLPCAFWDHVKPVIGVPQYLGTQIHLARVTQEILSILNSYIRFAGCNRPTESEPWGTLWECAIPFLRWSLSFSQMSSGHSTSLAAPQVGHHHDGCKVGSMYVGDHLGAEV